MQGKHTFDPKVKVSIDLESLVVEDHLVRRIDSILNDVKSILVSGPDLACSRCGSGLFYWSSSRGGPG